MEIASAYVSLLPSAKGFGSKMEREIGGQTKNVGKRLGAGFGKAFAAGGALIAAAGIGSFLKGSIDEAREAQKVGAATEAILKATGGAAKLSAKQIGDLTSSLSAKTAVDDEQIQAGANLLLTFKNVKREGEGLNDIFGRATAAGLDLAAAGFGSVEGNAKQLGKALNDPLKGISALSKAGVTFTDGQKDQIEGFVEANDLLSAQKIILGEVEKQVGGTAAATATSGEKAAVAFGNLKEQVGTALLPVIDKVASFLSEKVIPAVSDFVAGIQDGSGAGGQFGAIMSKVYNNAIKPLGEFLTGTVVPAIRKFISGMQDGTGLGGKFRAFLVGLGDTLRPIGNFIINTVVPAVSKFIGQMDSGTGAGGKFVDIVGGILGALKVVADFVIRSVIPALARFVGFIIRTVVPAALKIAVALLRTASFGVQAFSFLLDAALACFEGILSAADKGLGWIPGLGGKIHDANEAFSNFRESTINALDSVAQKTKNAADALDKLAEPRSTTFTTTYINEFIAKRQAQHVDQLASGTNSARGGLTLVGENGPELVNMRRGAQVLTADQTRALTRNPLANAGLRDSGFAGSGGIPRTLILRVGDRDFTAYVSEVADSRVLSASDLANERRRASWSTSPR